MAAMIAAFRRVEGRHDFGAFQASGSEVRDTIRTMSLARATVRGQGGPARAGEAGIVEFELTGDGFLRHMVRNVIGTVIEVGRGRRAVETIDELLAGAPRAHAGPTAPAHGLCLMRVTY
jgi:tRNA pseudouridine38-40 synthase